VWKWDRKTGLLEKDRGMDVTYVPFVIYTVSHGILINDIKK